MSPHFPTRREFISSLGIAAVGAAMGSPQTQPTDQPVPIAKLAVAVRDMRDSLHQELVGRIKNSRLTRPDGYLYTIDAAQSMICLAQLGDADGYLMLRDHCLQHLIRDDPTDPYTRGFVTWRFKPGDDPDASGTTEALRVAQAFWIGSKVFQRPADADTARMVLHGYAHHAETVSGIWLIRNYFAYQKRVFAVNSYLVDYDPDLLRLVADATQDAQLRDVADRSLKAVETSLAPCGLLYDLIQPELETLYPELSIGAFSPNDVIGLANSCTTALGATQSAPMLAQLIIRFAQLRQDDLRRYYLGRSGLPADPAPAAVCEYVGLVRLAVAIGDAEAATRFLNSAVAQWQWCVEHPQSFDAFLCTEILSAAIAVTAAST